MEHRMKNKPRTVHNLATGFAPYAWAASMAAALAVLPRLAWAHHFMGGRVPETFGQGLLSGLGHPVIGPDHVAFVIGAGFFLALVDGGLWGIGALICGSLVGAGLHLGGIGLPGGEVGVALSVILVGALVLARRSVKSGWLIAGLAVAGLLHGYAYAESIFGAEAAPLTAYLIGFSLIQGAIASGAFWVHRRLIATGEAWVRRVSAGLGALVGVTGVVFLVLQLVG